MREVDVLFSYPDMTNAPVHIYGEEYLAYQTKAGAARRLVRHSFLRHAASLCCGRVLDLGCGGGALLRLLPTGSRGLEVNPYAVDFCRRLGLHVDLYEPNDDDYCLRQILPEKFGTLMVSHVLEHLPGPDEIVRKLCAACRRLGIGRIVIVVPCARGFHADATHRTFVDREYLETRGLF